MHSRIWAVALPWSRFARTVARTLWGRIKCRHEATWKGEEELDDHQTITASKRMLAYSTVCIRVESSISRVRSTVRSTVGHGNVLYMSDCRGSPIANDVGRRGRT